MVVFSDHQYATTHFTQNATATVCLFLWSEAYRLMSREVLLSSRSVSVLVLTAPVPEVPLDGGSTIWAGNEVDTAFAYILPAEPIVGHTFAISIRQHTDKHPRVGGDDFFVRLVGPTIVVPVAVIDHLNGTYTLYFHPTDPGFSVATKRRRCVWSAGVPVPVRVDR
jgi:hypothetical protein